VPARAVGDAPPKRQSRLHNERMKVDLSDFTLCAAGSTNVALTVRAIHRSLEQCKFADAVLFTHEPPPADGFRTVTIDKLDREGYQNFRIKPPPTIETPFTLFVEWDGFVVEPRAWRTDFRNFDFIGARFLEHGVSVSYFNSGFCLQSKKFNAALGDPRFTVIRGQSIDGMICGAFRPALERDYGIRFPTHEVADAFSYEWAHQPVRTTFGFHGLGNMPRYFSDAEMIEIIGMTDPSVLRTWQFILLLVTYAQQAKFAVIEQLYRHMRANMPLDEVRNTFQFVRQPARDEIFNLCERLVDGSMWIT